MTIGGCVPLIGGSYPWSFGPGILINPYVSAFAHSFGRHHDGDHVSTRHAVLLWSVWDLDHKLVSCKPQKGHTLVKRAPWSLFKGSPRDVLQTNWCSRTVKLVEIER